MADLGHKYGLLRLGRVPLHMNSYNGREFISSVDVDIIGRLRLLLKSLTWETWMACLGECNTPQLTSKSLI